MKFMNYGNWDGTYRETEGGEGEGGSSGEGSGEGESEGGEAGEAGTGGEGEGSGEGEGGEKNWRDEYLGDKDSDGNEIDADTQAKRKNILDRFTDKNQLTKSYFDLHKKVSQGLKAPELPKDATEEQVAEYRKQVGLPENVEAYEYKLADGLVLNDADQTMVDGLKETALNNGVNPTQMSAIITQNLAMREEQMVARTNRDSMLQGQSADALHERWDDDYQSNINAITNTFNAMPGADEDDGLRMQFENARLPNGDRIFDNPDMMNFFALLSRKANPQSTLSTGEGGMSVGRLKALEDKMAGEGLTDSERNEWARLNDAKEGISA